MRFFKLVSYPSWNWGSLPLLTGRALGSYESSEWPAVTAPKSQGWDRGQKSREPVWGDHPLIYPEPADQDSNFWWQKSTELTNPNLFQAGTSTSRLTISSSIQCLAQSVQAWPPAPVTWSLSTFQEAENLFNSWARLGMRECACRYP